MGGRNSGNFREFPCRVPESPGVPKDSLRNAWGRVKTSLPQPSCPPSARRIRPPPRALHLRDPPANGRNQQRPSKAPGTPARKHAKPTRLKRPMRPQPQQLERTGRLQRAPPNNLQGKYTPPPFVMHPALTNDPLPNHHAHFALTAHSRPQPMRSHQQPMRSHPRLHR